MTIDKDGLASLSKPRSEMSRAELYDMIDGLQETVMLCAQRPSMPAALPNTGDELVAPETVAWRYAESDVEWGTTTEAAKAGRLSEIVPVEPLIRLVDHQAAIRANAAAAEASLASAQEALDWYADRVGLAGAMTAEGAKARAELTQDNGARALKEVR